MSKEYFVYMLKCADDTFYTGCALDVEKRVRAHNHLKSGARYTKARRPVALVYSEKVATKGEALSREAALKKFSRQEKLTLVHTVPKVA